MRSPRRYRRRSRAGTARGECRSPAAVRTAGRLFRRPVVERRRWPRSARAARGAGRHRCRRVEYCDGAGIALLIDLLRQPRSAGAGSDVRNLPDRSSACSTNSTRSASHRKPRRPRNACR